MKIKDIISEGFFSGFAKELVPKAMRPALDAGKPYGEPTEIELAKIAHQKFGDNPESLLPGFMGWLSPKQQTDLVNKRAEIIKQQERKAAMQTKVQKQSKGMQNLARDINQGIKIQGQTTSSPAAIRQQKQTAAAKAAQAQMATNNPSQKGQA
jgi:hypothetical protein